APLFRLARRSFPGLAGLEVRLGAARLFGLFLADAVFLEVHQLLQGEEDRAFLLVSHASASLLRGQSRSGAHSPHPESLAQTGHASRHVEFESYRNSSHEPSPRRSATRISRMSH